MMFLLLPFLLLIISSVSVSHSSLDSPSSITLSQFVASPNFSFAGQRFLLFDVNPGEGFNLRRDVYMRVANAVRQLGERGRLKGRHFIVVLPSWRNIWHWRKKQKQTVEKGIRWSELFDLEALSSFVPVMEFDKFVDGMGDEIGVDSVLYLQHYAEGWEETKGFVLKFDERPCCVEAGERYHQKSATNWLATSSNYGPKFQSKELKCLSIQGQSSTLADAIINLLPESRSVLIDRAEVILHDQFGDSFYWAARKSMRYSANLRQIGDAFRTEQFNSSGNKEKGEKYLGAHLRRADFVWSHAADIPSIEGAARQIFALATKSSIYDLFLSTDANPSEVSTLSDLLSDFGIRTVRFIDRADNNLSEAAISIIDQWICAHSRYFVGTHLSTFSFRIHEDREILGFPANSTFNRFCPDDQMECEQPAKWKIPK